MVGAVFGAQMAERGKQALLARSDLTLARDLSRSLREKDQEGLIELIPQIQRFLQEFGLIDGKRQHLVGIETSEGDLLRIEDKDLEIYEGQEFTLSRRSPTPAQEFFLRASEIDGVFQAIIDRTNSRFLVWGDLYGTDNEGNPFKVGIEDLEETIRALQQGGREVRDKGMLAELRSRDYEITLTPISSIAPEGDHSPVEKKS